MAPLLMRDVKLYMSGYDISGSANECAVEDSREIIDKTAFGATARAKLAGLRVGMVSASGFSESGLGLIETLLAANNGTANQLITVAPDGGEAGEPAWFMSSIQAELLPFGGPLGDANKFRFRAEAEDQPLVRGTMLYNGTNAGGVIVGTGFQVGAVATGKRLYIGFHLLALTGTTPSLNVLIESDDNSGFTSGTVRKTFNATTAVGGYYDSVAGPITDDWWRITTSTAGGSITSQTTLVTIAIC